ncbi:MAG: TolC family protein [Acidobacteriota bacterium]
MIFKKKNKSFTLLFTVMFLLTCSVSSKEISSSVNGLTLDECVSIALNKNPMIVSALKRYEASKARVYQAKAFPQPEIAYDSDFQPIFFNFREAKESYLGMNQLLEFPGKRFLRGKIAKKESDEFLAEVEIIKLDLIFQLAKAFYKLLLSHEIESYARENLSLSKDFFDKARIKYETGDVARFEVLRAEVEVAKAENELKIATNEIKLSIARLNFLLAREKYQPLEILGKLKREPLRLKLEDLQNLAFINRPEMRKINNSIERENLSYKYASLGYMPDFNLNVSEHRIKESAENFGRVAFSLSLPVFFWQRKKGEIAEAKANIDSFKYELEYIKNLISLEVEEAYLNSIALENQIRLFEEQILKQAEKVYEMTILSYQEGAVGSLDLIESRRTLIEAKKSYAEALFNYNLSIAELEKAIGKKI